jgi:hypothetical protein
VLTGGVAVRYIGMEESGFARMELGLELFLLLETFQKFGLFYIF